MVTVENQGNMAEKDVPVTVTLSSESSDPAADRDREDPRAQAQGDQTTVTVDGLNPTAYGEVALLRVEVGPVPSEKIKENNVIEATRHLQTLAGCP